MITPPSEPSAILPACTHLKGVRLHASAERLRAALNSACNALMSSGTFEFPLGKTTPSMEVPAFAVNAQQAKDCPECSSPPSPRDVILALAPGPWAELACLGAHLLNRSLLLTRSLREAISSCDSDS